jgi:hypothetical protein
MSDPGKAVFLSYASPSVAKAMEGRPDAVMEVLS